MKYKLNQVKTEKDYFEVIIKADSNDGDYVTESCTFTKEEFDDFIIKGLIELKDFSGNHQLENFPDTHSLDMIPYNGYDGWCHSIESVSVKLYKTDSTIWDVEY